MELESLSDETKVLLLQLARISIQSLFEESSLTFDSSSLSIKNSYGIFVTLWKDQEVRGCMGNPFPTKSLEETLQEVAIFSAIDSGYPPIQAEELPFINIEIALLTPPISIKPDHIQLGIHGLIISQEEQTALLLPHMPVEYGWTKEEFLKELCLKADLPKDAWKKASLSAFKTVVFSEQSLKTELIKLI